MKKELKDKIIEILTKNMDNWIRKDVLADQLLELFSQEKQKLVEGETERFKKYVLDNCSAGYKKYWAKIEKQLERSGGNK